MQSGDGRAHLVQISCDEATRENGNGALEPQRRTGRTHRTARPQPRLGKLSPHLILAPAPRARSRRFRAIEEGHDLPHPPPAGERAGLDARPLSDGVIRLLARLIATWHRVESMENAQASQCLRYPNGTPSQLAKLKCAGLVP